MSYRFLERLTALAVSVVLLAGAAGCSSQAGDPPSDTPTTMPSSVIAPTDASAAEGEVLCETPYITLVRPEYWDERIQVKGLDGVGSYTLQFTTTVNEKEAMLFSFAFAENGNGYRLGQMTDAGGKTVWVYSTVEPFEVGEEWTEDEVQTLTALQECVNEILNQIQTASNFSN